MAAVGLLRGMLDLDGTAVALTIATYIAIDSFGTATNTTGDGAPAVVMSKLIGRRTVAEAERAASEELAFSGTPLAR